MMLVPYMNELLKKIDNRYLLVNVVAKRARIIAEEAGEANSGEHGKPVRLALEEINSGLIRVIPGEAPHDSRDADET